MANRAPSPLPFSEHTRAHRPSLVPRLHARLDVLLSRLQGHEHAPPGWDALAEALHAAVDRIADAEQSVHATDWVAALRVAQNCESALREALAAARALPPEARAHPDPVVVTQALWTWLITQPELYCRLQVLHLGLAMRDPDDVDDDDDTDVVDYSGHLGEELVRQVAAAEGAVLAEWPQARYRLYRQLYTNYQRLKAYATPRGWVEESDALDYMMHRARMRGLHYYVWEPATRDVAGRIQRRPDRLAVLGRLLLDRMYWAIAGFGYRPLRAVVINVLVVTAFAVIYWAFNLLCVYSTSGALHQDPACHAVSLPQTLYFSALAFFLAAMGEIIPRPLWGQLLLVLESAWGFLNISVVIAVIINRHSGD